MGYCDAEIIVNLTLGTGAGLTTGVTANSAVRREFAVTLKDAYGNAAAGAVTVYIGFSPDSVAFPWLASMPSAVTAVVTAPTVTEISHGVAFTATYPGTYIVIVKVEGRALHSFPFMLTQRKQFVRPMTTFPHSCFD